MSKTKLLARDRYVEDPEIRSMRIRTWFESVAAKSDKTAAALEREFSEGESGSNGRPRSCIWQKYKKGLVEPQSTHGVGRKPGLVERVEQRYSGTAQWLTSPLWRLADKAPMEMNETKAIYEGLPSPIRSIFIASETEARGLFWRRPIDVDHACNILLRFRSIDGFQAVLAIVKEAETMQDQYQHDIGVGAAKKYMDTTTIQPSQPLVDIIRTDLSKYLQTCWQSPGYFSLTDDPE